ncbi:hypothetical protein [Qipengyuania oceanensis]|uniref:hypothetical protein n=1 Tax=Qipengyuania oceanensis TaxID=1463597 RepID=UPI0019289E2C|nr:hypothetical protein [Qipengyuania oceanensis]
MGQPFVEPQGLFALHADRAKGAVLVVFAAFVRLMRRADKGNDGRLSIYWWPVIAVGAFFAIFTIIQAPADAFYLLGALLALGTGLYFVARRELVDRLNRSSIHSSADQGDCIGSGGGT